MIHYDVLQYTREWWELRRGVPTASEFKRIITPVRGDFSESSEEYIRELISDLYRDDYFEGGNSYSSKEMMEGHAREPEARSWLQKAIGRQIRMGGICLTDDRRFGASPDGFIGEMEELTEIKCPSLKTQLERLEKGVIPTAYIPQVHGQMAVTGIRKLKFLSYCPPAESLLVEVEWSEYTDKLVNALNIFWDKYQQALKRTREKFIIERK